MLAYNANTYTRADGYLNTNGAATHIDRQSGHTDRHMSFVLYEKRTRLIKSLMIVDIITIIIITHTRRSHNEFIPRRRLFNILRWHDASHVFRGLAVSFSLLHQPSPFLPARDDGSLNPAGRVACQNM